MKVKIIHATKGCEDSSCPTIYQNEAGNYIIQGFKMKGEDKTSISIPEGEDAIVVPAEFLQEFIQKQTV